MPTLEPAYALFAQGLPGDRTLPVLAEFKRQLPILRSDREDVQSALTEAVLSRLGLTNGRLERPTTTGRSGDPVFFLTTHGQVHSVIKLYTKSLADLAKELIGMHTFKSAHLHLSQTVDLKDLFIINFNGREFPVMIMSLAPGRDMTQTIHQLAKHSISDSDALTTSAWMGRALAEFHQHFVWHPPSDHPSTRITKDYEAEKSRSMINDVVTKINEFVQESWMTESESTMFVERIQNAIHTYTTSETMELSFIHGDLNAGNVLFDPTQRQITFIDTQLSSNSTGPRDHNQRVLGVGEPMADMGRLTEAINIEGIEAGISPHQIAQMQEALIQSYLIGRQIDLDFIDTGLNYFRLRFDLQQLIGQIYVREPRVRCFVIHQLLIRLQIRNSSARAICN